jgi:hypothetical protein
MFFNGIIRLKLAISKSRYWILDGIEESLPWETLLMFLQKLSLSFSAKVFLSSRDFPETWEAAFMLRHGFRHRISAAATKKDIANYSKSNAAILLVSEDGRPKSIRELTAKSYGSWLFITLALEHLERGLCVLDWMGSSHLYEPGDVDLQLRHRLVGVGVGVDAPVGLGSCM